VVVVVVSEGMVIQSIRPIQMVHKFLEKPHVSRVKGFPLVQNPLAQGSAYDEWGLTRVGNHFVLY
jgi:hypothetical protein